MDISLKFRLISFFNSLKIRLTILYVFLFGITLVIFLFYILNQFIVIQEREFNKEFQNYIIEIADTIDIDKNGDFGFGPDLKKISERNFSFTLGKTQIMILNYRGDVLLTKPNLKKNSLIKFSKNELRLVEKNKFMLKTVVENNKKSRIGVYLIPTTISHVPYFLEVIVPTTALENIENKFINTFYLTIIIITSLSAIIGYFFSSRALRPMNEIIRETQQIKVDDLKRRIVLPRFKDEIWNLAATINELLDRIERAFESQEHFIQNASHQLKTPLAIIKGELALFNVQNQSSIELKKFLKNMSEEINNLIELNNNLLILAQIENGKGSYAFDLVKIDEIILGQIYRLTKFAFEKNVKLDINFNSLLAADEKKYLVKGDNYLLGVFFYNFIENAIKYSDDNSEVKIKAKLDESELTILIEDQGVGISDEEKKYIFERFYRGKNNKGGHGLGLAICQKIADIHNVTIELRDNVPHGSIFELKFSLSQMNREV